MAEKQAWVLRLKEEISNKEYDGVSLYLCDNEPIDFLTENLQQATIIYNKEQFIQETKDYDKYMIDEFGKDSIRNGGWEHISEHFDFVKVMLIYPKGAESEEKK